MPRFTLTQTLMGVALVSILLTFTRTEGCGGRITRIESLSFSSDDSRILVTKLAARHAGVSGKVYLADLSRTISWLDAGRGNSLGIVQEDYRRGNYGPASEFFRKERTAIAQASATLVTVLEFGGGDVTCDVGSAKANIPPLDDEIDTIAISPSGRLLAAWGRYLAIIYDIHNKSVLRRFPNEDTNMFFRGSMAFTHDDTRLVTAVGSEVIVWDISSGKKLSTVYQDSPFQNTHPRMNSVAVAPDDTVILCSDEWVRRYDMSGNLIATLSEKGGWAGCATRDGRRLAVSDGEAVNLYDLDSNAAVRSIAFDGVVTLTFSSGGDLLAMGHYPGKVTLVESATGARRWTANPPSRYRWPWSLPAALLVGWMFVAWKMSNRDEMHVPREITYPPPPGDGW